jgi:putative acetyltransferase
MTLPALRPFLPTDTPALAAILIASIEELTGDDYSEAQRAAWAEAGSDEDKLNARLAAQLTLIATIDGEPVGFAALRDQSHIDMLYVHPSAARRGVATMLCDALEKLAAARGTKTLTVDSSDTAQELFARRGYVAKQRNSIAIGGEWLANTTMEKALPSNAAPGAGS